MDDAGVDILLVTSRHNCRYFLGGYRPLFFAEFEAIGLSRYLPVIGYVKAKPEQSFYLCSPMEADQHELQPVWVPHVRTDSWTSRSAASAAADLIRARGHSGATVAIEMPFFPADAFHALVSALPHARIVDAVGILDELRAVKRPDELAMIRTASKAIVDSMLDVFSAVSPGVSTQTVAAELCAAERNRGLDFDYCLVATGKSFNRTPSDKRWNSGTIMSLDSGGSYMGYIGDLARMAVIGPPTAEMTELLEEVDGVQMSARKAIRAGVLGREITDAARLAIAERRHKDKITFEAHGQGLVSHESPHLTVTGSIPQLATQEARPLESGMVVSLETTLRHREIGFVKLEDTVAVTETGSEQYGDRGRGWNVVDA